MKLLNLLHEDTQNVEILTENTASGKNVYLEGVFAVAEMTNGNGRRYPHSVMEAAVQRFNDEYVSQNRAGGEINHPPRPFLDPNEIAIRVVEYKMVGNQVHGKALILNTAKGLTVKGLVEGGFRIGVSTRGMGSLKEKNGYKEVQPDFFKTAVDVVDNPSGPGCYPNAITESSKWMLNESSGIWVPVENQGVITRQIDEELLLERINDFLKGLKG